MESREGPGAEGWGFPLRLAAVEQILLTIVAEVMDLGETHDGKGRKITQAAKLAELPAVYDARHPVVSSRPFLAASHPSPKVPNLTDVTTCLRLTGGAANRTVPVSRSDKNHRPFAPSNRNLQPQLSLPDCH